MPQPTRNPSSKPWQPSVTCAAVLLVARSTSAVIWGSKVHLMQLCQPSYPVYFAVCQCLCMWASAPCLNVVAKGVSDKQVADRHPNGDHQS